MVQSSRCGWVVLPRSGFTAVSGSGQCSCSAVNQSISAVGSEHERAALMFWYPDRSSNAH